MASPEEQFFEFVDDHAGDFIDRLTDAVGIPMCCSLTLSLLLLCSHLWPPA
jgi:hypothetical protein